MRERSAPHLLDTDVSEDPSFLLNNDEVLVRLLRDREPISTGTVVELNQSREFGSPYQIPGGYPEIIAVLTDRLRALEATVASLQFERVLKTAAVVQTRALSAKETKAEIKAYFEENHGNTIYPSDVADALAFEYDTVVRMIEELESDGEITQAE